MTKKPRTEVAPTNMSTHLERLRNEASYLERLRNEALDQHNTLQMQARDAQHDVERTIADLENWRSELDATIAFLRAMRQ